MIIAFSGCSGSGKTTIINKIINKKSLINNEIIIKEEDSFLFLKVIKQILGKKTLSNYVEDKKYRRTNNKLWTFLYALMVYFEFLLEYICYEKVMPNKIIVRDRYIIDYLVTINKNLDLDNKFVTNLYKIFPKPSLSFYIDIDKNTILERNKNTKSEGWTENPRKFILDVLKTYQKLTSSNFIYIKNPNEATSFICLKLKLKNIKTISFSGVDGTGKTTLVKNFSKVLKDINVGTKIVHFYHDNTIFKILKLLKIIKIPKMDDKYYKLTRENTKKVKQKGKSLIWAFAHFIDSYLQYLFSMLNRGGKIILFDRYLYDYLISFEYFNIKNYKIFTKFIPKPNIAIVVTIDPQIAHKRKPENTIGFFKFSEIKYKNLAKKYKLLLLDANNKNKEELTHNLVERIIK